MHNNYYFLRQLSNSLNPVLHHAVISECFSQSKNELIIRFETHKGSFFIRANLQATLSCLSFTDNFNRARKNSVDLFPVLIGQRVLKIRQFQNERSFALELSNSFALVFKMHGTRSNVLFFEKDNVIDLFRNNLDADRLLTLDSLDRHIDWSLEHFKKNENNLQQVYFTFGKVVWQYLESRGFLKKSTEEKWNEIQNLKSTLEAPSYFISKIKTTPHLVLVRFGDVVNEFNDPIKAANEFFYTYTQVFALSQEKNNLLSVLKNKIKNGENYISKTSTKLKEVHDTHDYRILGDLIMANLHEIKSGTEKITVANLYKENEPIEIKLKKDLTPQKNAEAYYRKAKNQHLEIDQLEKALKIKEQEIQNIKNQIEQLESASDFSSVRQLASVIKPEKEAQPETLPYHEFEKSGFKIWVGKNAESNDTLTLKLSFKEDLWLHAKDVSGSHVLVKYQSGKKFPKDVIERAAELAAYNSKRKTETLAPVVYTPKKYVRKRKGDPPGMVVVERESVIMVEPRL